MSKALTIAERMKEYESVTNDSLMKRTPVIIRLDGVAFHTFTKGFKKPFDDIISNMMQYVCIKLKEKVNNVVLMYSQSDEISILLNDWEDVNKDCWFGNRIQKLCSVTASYATMYANQYLLETLSQSKNTEEASLLVTKVGKVAFDCRVFNLPTNDVTNYFIWRQKDAIRNSKSALGQAYFTHKELKGVKADEVVQMVKDKTDIDWNTLPLYQKYGFCLYKTEDKLSIDTEIPLFVEDREYVEKYL